MDRNDVDRIFGPDGWAAIMRFGVLQNGKWLMIDNGKHGANWTFASDETIHTSAAPAVAASLRRLMCLSGKRLRGRWQVSAGSRDMKAAYKQIAIDAQQSAFVVIAVFDVMSHRWRFIISRALLFGLSGSVLLFNRVPNLLVTIARRWLAIATHAFFDDFQIIDFKDSGGSAEFYFDHLMKFLGWRFDDCKKQSCLGRLPMLGNIECFDDLGASEQFRVEAKPERIEAIKLMAQGMLNARCVTSGDASSLRGKLVHVAATRPGRTGRIPIPFISEIADGKANGGSEGLEMDLQFTIDALSETPERFYPLLPTLEVGPRVWSDASFAVIDGVIEMHLYDCGDFVTCRGYRDRRHARIDSGTLPT